MGLKVVPVGQKLKCHKTYKLTLAFQHKGLFLLPNEKETMMSRCLDRKEV